MNNLPKTVRLWIDITMDENNKLGLSVIGASNTHSETVIIKTFHGDDAARLLNELTTI